MGLVSPAIQDWLRGEKTPPISFPFVSDWTETAPQALVARLGMWVGLVKVAQAQIAEKGVFR